MSPQKLYLFTILLLFGCKKDIYQEFLGKGENNPQIHTGAPTSCLSESYEMLLIMDRPSAQYFLAFKGPGMTDSVKQDLFPGAIGVSGTPGTTQSIESFPDTSLLKLSASYDTYQTFDPGVIVNSPIKPYLLHDSLGSQSPQMGVRSEGPSNGRYIERPNQVRCGEILTFKTGKILDSLKLKFYGVRFYLRVPTNYQMLIIDLYKNSRLIYSWRPPQQLSVLGWYELKLSRTNVFDEIQFRIENQNTGGQVAIRGARTTSSSDKEVSAFATAPRFYITPDEPDLVYLVGSSTQRYANASEALATKQQFNSSGYLSGPSYLDFVASGTGSPVFATDQLGRFGATSASQPTVGITSAKSLSVISGTDFYGNRTMYGATLRLQNTGPIGTVARVQALTELDVPIGSPVDITFSSAGEMKIATLDFEIPFDRIKLSVPSGSPANSSFVLNPSPPNATAYQAFTKFYVNCD